MNKAKEVGKLGFSVLAASVITICMVGIAKADISLGIVKSANPQIQIRQTIQDNAIRLNNGEIGLIHSEIAGEIEIQESISINGDNEIASKQTNTLAADIIGEISAVDPRAEILKCKIKPVIELEQRSTVFAEHFPARIVPV